MLILKNNIMKNLIILIAFVAFGFTNNAIAQKKVETTFKVDGVCGMCKKRIETAMDIKGVSFAEWNKETSDLFVVYNPKKVSEDELHRLLNEAGHDTEKSKATNEQYNSINGCCRYREMEKH